jgi:hypothetical protein
MARYESAALSEEVSAYWSTKDLYNTISIVDEEHAKEIGLTMPEAMKLAQFIVKCAAEYLE